MSQDNKNMQVDEGSSINRAEDIKSGKTLDFDMPLATRRVIKVVGVGGGGGNALNHLYSESFDQISYLLLNTDGQDLEKSPIPNKLLLGPHVTKGLGAGDDANKAMRAAEESREEIREALSDGQTEIVFITAGIGGGTGTGATPVVARIAKQELGLLTVAIVTIPLLREGRNKIVKAINAVEELRKEVDATLVINNQKILELYPEESYTRSLFLADQTLANAVRSVSDLIYRNGVINVDANDVIKILKDGGVAIISTGIGEGENRVKDAIDQAINSPLLNGNDVYRASRLLVFHYESSTSPLMNNEMEPLDGLALSMERNFDSITGHGVDDSLGEKIKITILASGFNFATTKSDITTFDVDAVTKKEIAEREEKDNELLRLYYEDNDTYLSGSMAQARPFILEDDELDNEEIIRILDAEPAAKRDHSRLERLCSQLRPNSRRVVEDEDIFSRTKEPTDKAPRENETGGNTINFF